MVLTVFTLKADGIVRVIHQNERSKEFYGEAPRDGRAERGGLHVRELLGRAFGDDVATLEDLLAEMLPEGSGSWKGIVRVAGPAACHAAELSGGGRGSRSSPAKQRPNVVIPPASRPAGTTPSDQPVCASPCKLSHSALPWPLGKGFRACNSQPGRRNAPSTQPSAASHLRPSQPQLDQLEALLLGMGSRTTGTFTGSVAEGSLGAAPPHVPSRPQGTAAAAAVAASAAAGQAAPGVAPPAPDALLHVRRASATVLRQQVQGPDSDADGSGSLFGGSKGQLLLPSAARQPSWQLSRGLRRSSTAVLDALRTSTLACALLEPARAENSFVSAANVDSDVEACTGGASTSAVGTGIGGDTGVHSLCSAARASTRPRPSSASLRSASFTTRAVSFAASLPTFPIPGLQAGSAAGLLSGTLGDALLMFGSRASTDRLGRFSAALVARGSKADLPLLETHLEASGSTGMRAQPEQPAQRQRQPVDNSRNSNNDVKDNDSLMQSEPLLQEAGRKRPVEAEPVGPAGGSASVCPHSSPEPKAQQRCKEAGGPAASQAPGRMPHGGAQVPERRSGVRVQPATHVAATAPGARLAAVSPENAVVSSALLPGDGDDAPLEAWHEVWATRTTHPATGESIAVLLQHDVTLKVEVERHVMAVMDAGHRVLEQMFPRHVLQHMAESFTRSAQGGGLGRGQGGVGAGLGGSPGGGPAGAGAGLGGHKQCALWSALLGGGRPLAASDACRALARSHPQVTLLFADIKGFTPMCGVLEPHAVMAMLNELFSRFDELLDQHGVFKVETIGDCYFVAGGLIAEDDDGMAVVREERDPLHAHKVFTFAKAMLAAAREVRVPTSGEPVSIRIGMHTGPVVSGVVGTRMPRFCLFGDTVNTASRMESTGTPGAIHASEATHALLRAEAWTPTGGLEVKGKGRMQTYLWFPEYCPLDTADIHCCLGFRAGPAALMAGGASHGGEPDAADAASTQPCMGQQMAAGALPDEPDSEPDSFTLMPFMIRQKSG
ncbi:hypothetical protein GPECTOR_6g491 [Gonium pectorale]|uniref:Guanylate cyclase domain-containing protein n=1 Tax=Gonium pectorale TaxID=33097 RepID=A0A150GUV3_GONPE|nr:hypothetical protein GPECTOR_6g491 [Gonium pectorale]|eukprot:KXZ53574.1 hypothetical protein GPECTOR_6g491 [Gonium pectorale]